MSALNRFFLVLAVLATAGVGRTYAGESGTDRAKSHGNGSTTRDEWRDLRIEVLPDPPPQVYVQQPQQPAQMQQQMRPTVQRPVVTNPPPPPSFDSATDGARATGAMLTAGSTMLAEHSANQAAYNFQGVGGPGTVPLGAVYSTGGGSGGYGGYRMGGTYGLANGADGGGFISHPATLRSMEEEGRVAHLNGQRGINLQRRARIEEDEEFRGDLININRASDTYRIVTGNFQKGTDNFLRTFGVDPARRDAQTAGFEAAERAANQSFRVPRGLGGARGGGRQIKGLVPRKLEQFAPRGRGGWGGFLRGGRK